MSEKCGCAWFGHSDPNTKCHPGCKMADRIRELEAEVARLREWQDAFITAKDGTDSDFDKGDLLWLKCVADGAMDNLLSVGRAERTLLLIRELETAHNVRCDELDGMTSLYEQEKERAETAEAKLRTVEELPKLTTKFGLGGRVTVVLWDDVEALLK